MIEDVFIPEIGENIETGDVVKVLVAEGDLVEAEQALAEIETDKAVLELPSPARGRVSQILIKAGDTITIGQVVMRLEISSDGEPKTEDRLAPAKAADRPDRGPAPREAAKPLSSRSEPARSADAAAALPAAAGTPVPASPAVRRLARELGVDLQQVTGSGAGGRISTDDVKGHVQQALAGGRPSMPARSGLPDFERWGPIKRGELSKVRRITADNMTWSWTEIPHVTQHDAADVTRLESFRRENADRVEKVGGKLTVTAILVKISAAALKVFPRFNSSLDATAGELIYKEYYHIGIAVDTERGLLVPVLRNADQKTLTQIAIELAALGQRTRDKKITPDELEGGTFTISNLGGIGGTGFTPIVFAPQVAILGIARTQKQVTLADGRPVERLVLPLSLSYDHRVIDGADAARFVRWIVDAIENPYLALLGA